MYIWWESFELLSFLSLWSQYTPHSGVFTVQSQPQRIHSSEQLILSRLETKRMEFISVFCAEVECIGRSLITQDNTICAIHSVHVYIYELPYAIVMWCPRTWSFSYRVRPLTLITQIHQSFLFLFSFPIVCAPLALSVYFISFVCVQIFFCVSFSRDEHMNTEYTCRYRSTTAKKFSSAIASKNKSFFFPYDGHDALPHAWLAYNLDLGQITHFF